MKNNLSSCCGHKGGVCISTHGEDFGTPGDIHTCWMECSICKGACDASDGALPASADHKLLGESTPKPSKERNRKGIERMYSKMCEMNTPKRGELHRLLIQLFS